jgi:hypothetical protein
MAIYKFNWTEREKEAYDLREQDLSYAQIGEKMGITRSRAHALVNMATWRKSMREKFPEHADAKGETTTGEDE